MTAPTTFEQVKAFTVKFTGVKPAKITLDTTLENGLGITGDDGEDFIWAFFNEFEVDYTGFELTKYFAPEGFDPTGITLVIRKLFTNLPPLTSPIRDITIGDLVKSAHESRWIDPVV
jgi:hypothetical protein